MNILIHIKSKLYLCVILIHFEDNFKLKEEIKYISISTITIDIAQLYMFTS